MSRTGLMFFALFLPMVSSVPAVRATDATALEIAEITARFALLLEEKSPANLQWHYLPMPEEKHGTICHPAAIKAFREVFKPWA